MSTDTVNTKKKLAKKRNWGIFYNFNEILDEAKLSIDTSMSENPTTTLTTTLNETAGVENTYIWFGYIPQKIYNTTEDKFQDQ